MGDLNFSDGQQEEAHIDARYLDVWKHTHPNQDGTTMRAHDYDNNRYPDWRPDHGLLRSIEGGFTPIAAAVIGKDPIGDCEECSAKGLTCLVSDHYGLRFEIARLDSRDAGAAAEVDQ